MIYITPSVLSFLIFIQHYFNVKMLNEWNAKANNSNKLYMSLGFSEIRYGWRSQGCGSRMLSSRVAALFLFICLHVCQKVHITHNIMINYTKKLLKFTIFLLPRTKPCSRFNILFRKTHHWNPQKLQSWSLWANWRACSIIPV